MPSSARRNVLWPNVGQRLLQLVEILFVSLASSRSADNVLLRFVRVRPALSSCPTLAEHLLAFCERVELDLVDQVDAAMGGDVVAGRVRRSRTCDAGDLVACVRPWLGTIWILEACVPLRCSTADDVENAVGVEQEFDLDLGHARGHGRNAAQLELTETGGNRGPARVHPGAR